MAMGGWMVCAQQGNQSSGVRRGRNTYYSLQVNRDPPPHPRRHKHKREMRSTPKIGACCRGGAHAIGPAISVSSSLANGMRLLGCILLSAFTYGLSACIVSLSCVCCCCAWALETIHNLPLESGGIHLNNQLLRNIGCPLFAALWRNCIVCLVGFLLLLTNVIKCFTPLGEEANQVNGTERRRFCFFYKRRCDTTDHRHRGTLFICLSCLSKVVFLIVAHIVAQRQPSASHT